MTRAELRDALRKALEDRSAVEIEVYKHVHTGIVSNFNFTETSVGFYGLYGGHGGYTIAYWPIVEITRFRVLKRPPWQEVGE